MRPMRPVFRAGWIFVRPIVGIGAAVQATQRGYPAIGVAVIVLAFILTGIYVQRANGRFDQLTAALKRDLGR